MLGQMSVMATPCCLARLPSYAPALRSLSTLSGWTIVKQGAATSSGCPCDKEDETAAPSAPSTTSAPGAHPAMALLRPRPATGLSSSSLAARFGRAAPTWPMGRSFASQATEPSSSQQQQQQPGASACSSTESERPPHDVTYLGPLSQQHKLLKRISITNTLVAFAAAPAIVAWADNISMVSRYGLAASLVFFGLITTGALHWVAHPYVHEMRYTAATGQIDVRTTTLLGNSRWHSFNVDDVQPLPWNRPVATFVARDQFYYIDVFNFPDEALLRRLTPDEADVPKGYKDKEDEDD